MRRRPKVDIGLLAGWLFADLLLGFAIIALASSGGGVLAAEPLGQPTPATTTTTTTTTTTVPTTTTTTRPVGVEQTPHVVELQGDYGVMTGGASPARDAEIARLRDELLGILGRDGYSGRRAALVLTFGFHPQVGAGQQLAAAFNETTLATLPDIFGSAALRFFDYRANPAGKVRAEIYFFTSG